MFETIQVYLGSLYVNDFNRFGRTYQVIAQANAAFRDRPEDITRLKTRNAQGQMVTLGAFLKVKEIRGPDRVMHYNGYPSADINGAPAPGFSSGQAEALIAKLAAETLPPGAQFEWTDLTCQKILPVWSRRNREIAQSAAWRWNGIPRGSRPQRAKSSHLPNAPGSRAGPSGKLPKVRHGVGTEDHFSNVR